jgi:acid phosphatase (class A)
MNTTRRAQIALLVVAAAANVACAQASAPSRSAARAGYLAGSALPDMIRVLPPAPVSGGPVDAADRAIFRATRSLEGTPRWTLARDDNDLSVAYLLSAFRCSTGLPLDARSTPRLAALLGRLREDAFGAMDPPKNKYQRKRPFLVQQGPVCIQDTSALVNDGDYPSGHTMIGWVTGLILAELVPDHSADILVRARAYGESRAVCGVHNASAVQAGRTAGSALLAALQGSAAFRADLEAARAELAALHAGKPASCVKEAAVLATSPY